MYIVISLKKLCECVKEINDSCSGGSSWPNGELILKQMTVIRMQKGRIEVVLDDWFFHQSGKMPYKKIQNKNQIAYRAFRDKLGSQKLVVYNVSI